MKNDFDPAAHVSGLTGAQLDRLADYIDDRLGRASIRWHVDDVKTERPDLDDEQAMAVLDEVVSDHDATVGVTWDTLGMAATRLFGPRPDTEDDDD